ncbi:MAG: hypothetical protein NT171_15995 [Planctomycetota bacterium]|nr:hypothetical protein [Planctomycetota bacterium]
MAKKKAATVSQPAAATASKRPLKKKPKIAEPSLAATLPSTVDFKRGTSTRFTVLGSNLFATTKVPPPTTVSTLTLWTDLGLPVYTFPESAVSVYDGGPQAFSVQAMWRTALKKSGFAGSGKMVLTVHTGFPIKQIKTKSFLVTIN